ncbi:unnamed protein product [Caenorhabditis auriculariae]|uniref:LITAF domain-containing protein n=1 Tax=Caenorhabditis auriculariae TaxID=2777116 RepID=A0A8S1HN65_9PELO|nr:unnamed protein product [Caenorhabditis auriculariae]
MKSGRKVSPDGPSLLGGSPKRALFLLRPIIFAGVCPEVHFSEADATAMLAVLLLLLYFSSSDAVEYKIAVLILGDQPFAEASRSVTNAMEEVFGGQIYSMGEDTVEAVYVDGTSSKNPLNRLELTSDVVCGQMLNGSLAAIVFTPTMTSTSTSEYYTLLSTAAYALSFYHMPVVGVMARDAEFSKKNIYPTFVRPTASLSDESFVFMHLLLRLQYRQVVVLSVKGDRNGERFVDEFERRRLEFKIIVQRYVEVELDNNLNNTLAEHFEEVTSNIIVLFARKSHAVRIFENAGDQTGPGKVWVVSQSASEAHNLPKGSLGFRLSQTPNSVLRDSLAILKKSLEKVLIGEIGKPLLPPMECDRDSVAVKWSDVQAPAILKAICETKTQRIHFNDQCERISVEYDVINFHEGRRQVGSLTGGDLRLDEDAIRWAGSHKPLEISLPKHLRVVTVADAPFVFATPTISLHDCKELKSVKMKMAKDDVIDVPGPWFPCPMEAGINTTRQLFCCSGLAIDLLTYLSQPEGVGMAINGAIGELDADMSDMAIGALTINPERERIIDFSEPWLYHGIRILEKTIPRDSPMQSFLQPLESSLWTALLVSVVLVGLAIFLLDFKSPFDRFYNVDKSKLAPDDPFLERTVDDNVNFGEAMWFVWGVLLNSGVSEKTPRSCSARVLGIVWCGFCMIMVASYTANLAAFLVLDQPEKGLTGVTDPRLRNPSANFSFCTVLNSNVYQYFKRHVELSTMFRKMETHNVRKASDAVSALLNGSLDAFIWDSTRLEFEAARHCELRTRGSLFGRSAYGIGLQKNSPWTPHITAAILRMTESGVMETLDKKWIDNSGATCIVEVHKSPARLGLLNMKDIFILIATGVLLGMALSCVEVSYGRRLATRGRRRLLAMRYAEKWQRIACGARPRPRYDLARLVVRRGMSGIEPCTFEEIRRRREMRGLDTSLIRRDRFVPDLNFRDKPLMLFCPRCRNLVETDVHRVNGLFAVVCSVLLALAFLWPCSPLPCYLGCFGDYVHICPMCAHTIGRFRRARTPKFYV